MIKNLRTYSFNDRIRDVCPPHTDAEREMLMASIISEGVREPIYVWYDPEAGEDVIVDGHLRYEICHEQRIPFPVRRMDFNSEDEAVMWAATNQLARRNLNAFQKVELVLPLESQLRAEAKRRQGQRTDLHKGSNDEPGRTIEKLAMMSGVSKGSVHQVRYIIANGSLDLIRSLRRGEMSIYRAYCILKSRLESTVQRVDEDGVTVIRVSGHPNIVAGKHRDTLAPIRTAVAALIDLVKEGEAGPKAIVAELERVVGLIDGARA